jgi:hypothetical protein
MAKIHIVAQIYGYAVCLVTVLTILFSVPSLLESAIDLTDIQHSKNYSEKYSSFESYKVNVIRDMTTSYECDQELKAKNVKLPDDQILLKMYESEKDGSYRNALHRTRRTVIEKGFFILISALLFIFHWKWVRKFTASTE